MLERFEFKNQGIRMEKRANGVIWVCITDMAKVSDKRVDNWQRLTSTLTFLEALKHSLQCEVMESNVGGSLETTGTWVIRNGMLF